MNWPAVVLIGATVGFLGGLFGKGGSAVATPLLHAVGIPAMVAVAAPLPATVPGTLAATAAYRREQLLDPRLLRWSLGLGVPATVIGALATRWIDGAALVAATNVMVAALGIRLLLARRHPASERPIARDGGTRLAAVAVGVGLVSGLLANSGGFLLAPLYLLVLRLPVKRAFANSLAAAAVLALPGTFVHWALGHIDWAVVGAFAVASIPLSHLGARLALRADGARLERLYGAVLAALGVTMLLVAR